MKLALEFALDGAVTLCHRKLVSCSLYYELLRLLCFFLFLEKNVLVKYSRNYCCRGHEKFIPSGSVPILLQCESQISCMYKMLQLIGTLTYYILVI